MSMPVVLMRGMIWQITSHFYPHQTAVSLLQVTTSQSISTEGVVICHKIWRVAEWLCAVFHGSLVVCTSRGGSRIALSNVKYFYGVLILFIYLFFAFFLCQMTYDLRRVETFTLSRKPLNYAFIHQVTIPVEIYFLSSLGQRCTVYVHLNSIHIV